MTPEVIASVAVGWAISATIIAIIERRLRTAAERAHESLRKVFNEPIEAHLIGGPADGKIITTRNCERLAVPVLTALMQSEWHDERDTVPDPFVPIAVAEYVRQSVNYVHSRQKCST